MVGKQRERGRETGETIVTHRGAVTWESRVAGGRLIDKVGDRRGERQRKKASGTRYERG